MILDTGLLVLLTQCGNPPFSSKYLRMRIPASTLAPRRPFRCRHLRRTPLLRPPSRFVWIVRGTLCRFVSMPDACSAVGCSKRRGKENGARFFRFPSSKTHNNQRKKWIAALRRVNPDGTPWQPTSNARVCGAHFHTGKYTIADYTTICSMPHVTSHHIRDFDCSFFVEFIHSSLLA